MSEFCFGFTPSAFRGVMPFPRTVPSERGGTPPLISVEGVLPSCLMSLPEILRGVTVGSNELISLFGRPIASTASIPLVALGLRGFCSTKLLPYSSPIFRPPRGVFAATVARPPLGPE